MFTRSLERTHQQITEICCNLGVWNLGTYQRRRHLSILGMAETGININDARHFGIHKTNAYQTINRFCKQGLLETARNRTDRQKLNPLEERFIHITSRRGRFLSANRLCWTSRNCVRYARFRQNRQELSPMHLEDSQNVDILYFSNHVYNRHCAPYKWNETKFLLQRYIQDLVSNKTIIALAAKNLIKFVLISKDCCL